jgi:hypothetical protein
MQRLLKNEELAGFPFVSTGHLPTPDRCGPWWRKRTRDTNPILTDQLAVPLAFLSRKKSRKK